MPISMHTTTLYSSNTHVDAIWVRWKSSISSVLSDQILDSRTHYLCHSGPWEGRGTNGVILFFLCLEVLSHIPCQNWTRLAKWMLFFATQITLRNERLISPAAGNVAGKWPLIVSLSGDFLVRDKCLVQSCVFFQVQPTSNNFTVWGCKKLAFQLSSGQPGYPSSIAPHVVDWALCFNCVAPQLNLSFCPFLISCPPFHMCLSQEHSLINILFPAELDLRRARTSPLSRGKNILSPEHWTPPKTQSPFGIRVE